VINVSWYLNMDVKDGNLDPLDFNVEVTNETGSVTIDEDFIGGNGEVTVLSAHYTEELGIKMKRSVKVTSADGSGTFLTPFVNNWFFETTSVDLVMDIWPMNSFPTEVSIDEDTPTTWDLIDYFVDHEGEEFTYTIMTGQDLSYELVGTNLTLVNDQVDWNGDSWMHISATDGGNTTEVNTTVHVLAINDAPIFTSETPEFEIEEEGTDYFNFTGLVTDPEGDAMTWTIPETAGLDLDWDVENLNLTFTGIENWFGLTGIDVNVTDGTDWTVIPVVVNVTPVNDIPTWSLMLKNGTEAPMVEYVYNETTNWTVYLIETDEDVPVEFWIDASDIETAELLYSFVGADLLHGAIEVEMYQIEVIV
ncbi:MAG: hypothetical protein KAH57_02990, partial [Thermoplasmata archaeon]|nr:hypothetical protein [Thermoplasmata archaeon]